MSGGIVPLATLDGLPEWVRAMANGPREALIRALGHHGPGLGVYLAAYDAVCAPVTVAPRLVELVRLQVRAALAPGAELDLGAFALDHREAAAVVAGDTSPFDEATQRVLRWARLTIDDHHAISAASMEELRAHFSDAQLVELGRAIMVFHVLERVALALGVPPP
jgi:alkylhydroperoxidase family enzyme